MKEYRVVSQTELYATSPTEAAQKALGMLRDPELMATVFDVYRQRIDEGRLFRVAEPARVDLQEYWVRGLPKRKR